MNIEDYFYLTVSDDQMVAQIHCTDSYEQLEKQIDAISLIQYLNEKNITYGIFQEAISSIIATKNKDNFPITVAKGTPPKNGKDGTIKYTFDYSTKIERSDDWNFRDVMRIPTVKKGDKLAEVTLPSEGKNGKNVYGKTLRARKGKKVQVFAGKNVEFKEEKLAYFATIDGQVSIASSSIEVQEVYEVHDDLSMEIGNLDFVGTIIIHGDVPAGYKVNAGGDVKVFGLVEAAEIVAGGSVYISEGFAGMNKGKIEAGEDIHIGYINQGTAIAKNDIYVQNSILHSSCQASSSIFCQNGNIIGGSISVGDIVEAKDIGNRLNTETSITFFKDEKIERIEQLENEKNQLNVTLDKLELIRKQLEKEKNKNAKVRITLLRQQNSQKKVTEQLQAIDAQIKKIKNESLREKQPELIVRNIMYPNVEITFGKYKHKIDKEHQRVKISLVNKEVTIQHL